MKVDVKVYPRGAKVYAISRHYKDGKATDSLTIYEAVVVYFGSEYDAKTNREKMTYLLSTPDGREWGDYVDEDEVDEDFYVLVEKVKKEWIKNSNTFGDD